jgi:hypothetical protein
VCQASQKPPSKAVERRLAIARGALGAALIRQAGPLVLVFPVTSAAFWGPGRGNEKKSWLYERTFFDCGPNLYNHGLPSLSNSRYPACREFAI